MRTITSKITYNQWGLKTSIIQIQSMRTKTSINQIQTLRFKTSINQIQSMGTKTPINQTGPEHLSFKSNQWEQKHPSIKYYQLGPNQSIKSNAVHMSDGPEAQNKDGGRSQGKVLSNVHAYWGKQLNKELGI